MNSEVLYLRPNVLVEPLFDSWYAWSYLIPPATAARNITGRHMKIMDSYIAAPEEHAKAVANPIQRAVEHMPAPSYALSPVFPYS